MSNAFFKRWFGDWENDPENASKVVDESGEPLVVYRGSPEDMGFVFEYGKSFYGGNRGFWFAGAKTVAERYAFNEITGETGDLKAVYLKIKNPIDLTPLNRRTTSKRFYEFLRDNYKIDMGQGSGKEFEVARLYEKHQDAIYSMGEYDGIIMQDSGFRAFIAKKPEQIKSATSNTGAFDGGNPDIRFARRLTAAERERRAKDPRWQITEALRGILRKEGIINFNTALSNWGAIPAGVKDDTDKRKAWEHKWLRAESEFTRFARLNPEYFIDAGFPEAADSERDIEDRFDAHDVIYKIPQWQNDFDEGVFRTSIEEDADADPLTSGAQIAALDSLTEGMAPHEKEAVYWEGHYPMPELESAPLEQLARQNAGRGRATFTNAGEEFTARRDKDGGWVIRDTHGRQTELEAGAKIWVDKGQLKLVAVEMEAANAAADLKLAEAAIKKAEAKKAEADRKKSDADAKKAEATAAANAAKVEANKLQTAEAQARARAAEFAAKKAAADADMAAKETEKAKAERETAKETTRKARAEADKAKAEAQKERETARKAKWEMRSKAWDAKTKALNAKRPRDEAVKALVKELANQAFRLNAIRGKRASTMDLNANKRLDTIVDNLAELRGHIGKTINFFQDMAIDTIRNNPDIAPGLLDDITRWKEERASMPQFVREELEAQIRAAVAYLTTAQVKDLMNVIGDIKVEGRLALGEQVLADALDRRNAIDGMIRRMAATGKIRAELARGHGARVRDNEVKRDSAWKLLAGQIHWSTLRAERIFAWYDNIIGKKNGLDNPNLMTNRIFNPISDADAAKDIATKKALDKFAEIIRGINLCGHNVLKSKSLNQIL